MDHSLKIWCLDKEQIQDAIEKSRTYVADTEQRYTRVIIVVMMMTMVMLVKTIMIFFLYSAASRYAFRAFLALTNIHFLV